MSSAKDVLDSPAYEEILAEVARRTGISIFPQYPAPLQELDSKNVTLAAAPVDTLKDVLQTDRANLVEFSVEKLKKFDGVATKQEYPPGEEPGDEDRDSNVTVQGYSRGFLLINLLEYFVLRDRPDALEAFLKARRIPQAKQYATDLRTLFKKVRPA